MKKTPKEALEGMFDLIKSQDSFEKAQKYYDTVEDALNRLESIDNSNPSEAFETVYNNIDYLTSDIIIEDDEVNGCLMTIKEHLPTIKQALQKAQEPKHYLKWEDLEFDYGTKYQKVRMGDTIYKISYRCCDGVKEVRLLSEDEKFLYVSSFSNYKDNIQLFNDLHLERVEE